MKAIINFYSENKGEIKKFLDSYYSKNLNIENDYTYQEEFDNPIDMIGIISCFVDNNTKFNINIWISLDPNVYICVTDHNVDHLIKYLYERYHN